VLLPGGSIHWQNSRDLLPLSYHYIDGIHLQGKVSIAVMEEATDDELVRLALTDHKDAFRLLMERYQVMALCLTIRFTKNEEIARELVQEAMLQAYLSLEQIIIWLLFPLSCMFALIYFHKNSMVYQVPFSPQGTPVAGALKLDDQRDYQQGYQPVYEEGGTVYEYKQQDNAPVENALVRDDMMTMKNRDAH